MIKYYFFIIFGIILYLLLNTYNSFSIGVPFRRVYNGNEDGNSSEEEDDPNYYTINIPDQIILIYGEIWGIGRMYMVENQILQAVVRDQYGNTVINHQVRRRIRSILEDANNMIEAYNPENINILTNVPIDDLWYLFMHQMGDDAIYGHFDINVTDIRDEWNIRQSRLNILLGNAENMQVEQIPGYVQGLSDDDIQFLAINIVYYQFNQQNLQVNQIPPIGNNDINIAIAREVRRQIAIRFLFPNRDRLITIMGQIFTNLTTNQGINLYLTFDDFQFLHDNMYIIRQVANTTLIQVINDEYNRQLEQIQIANLSRSYCASGSKRIRIG